MMNKRSLLICAVLAVVWVAGGASATDQWFALTGLWTNNASWWSGVAPVAGDTVGHDGGDQTCIIDLTVAVASLDLRVGDWGPGPNGSMAYLSMTGGSLTIETNYILGNRPYEDWGNPAWANWGHGQTDMSGGSAVVGGNLAVGVEGYGIFNLTGGTIKAQSFSMGIVDPEIPGDPDNRMDIAGGKLLLAGNITSLDPRVVAYGGAGSLVFEYEADLPGYTTITGIPEPATMMLLGFGGLVLARRRKSA